MTGVQTCALPILKQTDISENEEFLYQEIRKQAKAVGTISGHLVVTGESPPTVPSVDVSTGNVIMRGNGCLIWTVGTQCWCYRPLVENGVMTRTLITCP